MTRIEKTLLGALAVDLFALVVMAAFMETGGSPHTTAIRASPSASLTPATSASPRDSPSPSPTPAPTPSVPPPARADAAMAYDSANGVVVMFGGVQNGRYLADTWTWDGRGWSRQQGGPVPAARAAAGMAYDSVHHQVVMFGGTDGGYLNDTWTWDGHAWTQMSPTTRPPARKFPAMAFDQARGVTVMYGGQATVTYTSTWSWNGSNWRLLHPLHSPGARHQAGIAFDARRGYMLLYGGSLPGVRLYDTWRWNGSDWALAAYGPYAARGWSQLAFNDSLGEVVAFVTHALPEPPTNYMLRWDGTRWTQMPLPSDFRARTGAALSFHTASSQLVLFGGNVAGVASNDTLAWLMTV